MSKGVGEKCLGIGSRLYTERVACVLSFVRIKEVIARSAIYIFINNKGLLASLLKKVEYGKRYFTISKLSCKRW